MKRTSRSSRGRIPRPESSSIWTAYCWNQDKSGSIYFALCRSASASPQRATRISPQPLGQSVDADMAQFFPGLERSDVTDIYYEIFPDHLDAIRPMPGVGEMLTSLRQYNIPCAVVTNTPSALAKQMLGHFDLLDHFRFVFGTGELKAKPDPEMILHALEALGVSAETVLYIGDSSTDRLAAMAAGTYFLGFGIDGDTRIESLAEIDTLVT